MKNSPRIEIIVLKSLLIDIYFVNITNKMRDFHLGVRFIVIIYL